MEAVIDQLAAVEAVEAVEAAADDRKSRKKQLSRTSSSDSDEMYSGGSPKGKFKYWCIYILILSLSSPGFALDFPITIESVLLDYKRMTIL